VNNRAYFPYLANGDSVGHWIQFQTGNYQIRHAEFYSAQFKLLGDRYRGLLYAFSAEPLYLSFVKIVHTLAMSEFGSYGFANLNDLRDDGDIQSTTK
jgi:hypothetical protein